MDGRGSDGATGEFPDAGGSATRGDDEGEAPCGARVTICTGGGGWGVSWPSPQEGTKQAHRFQIWWEIMGTVMAA
jgi:hypothetical protein